MERGPYRGADVIKQSIAGQIIQSQTPPDFSLLSLETNPNGMTFQLKWVGN